MARRTIYLDEKAEQDLQVIMERLDMKNVSQVVAVALLGLSQAMPEDFPRWEGRWRIIGFGVNNDEENDYAFQLLKDLNRTIKCPHCKKSFVDERFEYVLFGY